MSGRIGAHFRSNVVGYMALFVALSGTAWAAATVGSGDIKPNAVRSKHIKNGQVSGADVGSGALTGANIADHSIVGYNDVASQSVGGGQIDESTLENVDASFLNGHPPGDYDTLWAKWEYNGTSFVVERGEGATGGAFTTSPTVRIDFNRDVSTCGYVSTPTGSAGKAIIMENEWAGPSNPNSVLVKSYDAAGVGDITGFYLAVYCP